MPDQQNQQLGGQPGGMNAAPVAPAANNSSSAAPSLQPQASQAQQAPPQQSQPQQVPPPSTPASSGLPPLSNPALQGNQPNSINNNQQQTTPAMPATPKSAQTQPAKTGSSKLMSRLIMGLVILVIFVLGLLVGYLVANSALVASLFGDIPVVAVEGSVAGEATSQAVSLTEITEQVGGKVEVRGETQSPLPNVHISIEDDRGNILATTFLQQVSSEWAETIDVTNSPRTTEGKVIVRTGDQQIVAQQQVTFARQVSDKLVVNAPLPEQVMVTDDIVIWGELRSDAPKRMRIALIDQDNAIVVEDDLRVYATGSEGEFIDFYHTFQIEEAVAGPAELRFYAMDNQSVVGEPLVTIPVRIAAVIR